MDDRPIPASFSLYLHPLSADTEKGFPREDDGFSTALEGPRISRHLQIFAAATALTSSLPDDLKNSLGFHIYDRISSLHKKLELATTPLHKLWAAAEDLRLLFDAHASWLFVPEAFRDSPEGAWEVATLTARERAGLQPYVTGAEVPLTLRHITTEGGSWRELTAELGQQNETARTNGNLSCVDGIAVIEIPGSADCRPWRLVLFMEHHTPNRKTKRLSTEICQALFVGQGAADRFSMLRTLLQGLNLPFGTVVPRSVSMPELPAVDRDHLPESSQFEPEQFINRYEQSFRSLHWILSQLSDFMNTAVRQQVPTADEQVTVILSYRQLDQRFICFFPTPAQARAMIQKAEDVDDFLFFWGFQYPRSRAISGWVLSTGVSDYVEHFDEDPRWKAWISDATAAEKVAIERQLQLVQRAFGTGGGEHRQHFAFLIPVVLQQSVEGVLEPLVMASITSSAPLQVAVRGQLVDLAWRAAPAIRMALAAQLNLEKLYKNAEELAVKEAEIRAEAAFASGIAHEIPQPLSIIKYDLTSIASALAKPSPDQLERASISVARALAATTDIMLVQETMVEYARLRQGLPCDRNHCDIRAVLDEAIDKFRKYLQVMDLEEISVVLEAGPEMPRVFVNSPLVLLACNNLLRNAIDVLKNQGGQIRAQLRANQGSVELTVSDNGPGIPESVKQDLQRGIRRTTKQKGIGLGYPFIYLCCKANGIALDIDSSPRRGTSVMLRLPVEDKTDAKEGAV